MAKVVYVTAEGNRREVEVENGVSLMQAALSNGIYEIVGDCGGSASCATCHCYVSEDYLARIPGIQPREEEMLESVAAERKPNSRLSCQIIMNDSLDGLVLDLPEEQW